MTELEFYKTLVKDLGVYSVFNGLRDALFYQLAVVSRIPIAYDQLESILTDEADAMSDEQSDFVNENISPGERFRYYTCTSDEIKVVYFVNVSKELTGKPAALHLQRHFPVPVNKISAVSTIVLFEKSDALTDRNYPKVIKHELVHAAVEYVIKDNPALREFYFAEENSKFIEFVCDMLPYVANPQKKENGLNKYIDDSIQYFGYDASEEMADFVRIVNMVYSEPDIVTDTIMPVAEGTAK